jgi:hypothetical protein
MLDPYEPTMYFEFTEPTGPRCKNDTPRRNHGDSVCRLVGTLSAELREWFPAWEALLKEKLA